MNPPTTTEAFASPSLGGGGGRAVEPAYELKFLLDYALSAEVEQWARERLVLDPHGEPALDGAYRTTSLYLDTPESDVFHGSPSYKRSKFRVRRYGTASVAFLERKKKWGDRVAKRRSTVPVPELASLAYPLSAVGWPGHWFHQHLLTRRLAPACCIAYQRTAYFGGSAASPVRVTLDRHIHGVPAGAWDLMPVAGGRPILQQQVILELKFRAALPGLFKELVAQWRLSPTAVSKYRLCRLAWETPAPCREAADA